MSHSPPLFRSSRSFQPTKLDATPQFIALELALLTIKRTRGGNVPTAFEVLMIGSKTRRRKWGGFGREGT